MLNPEVSAFVSRQTRKSHSCASEGAAILAKGGDTTADAVLDKVASRLVEQWEAEAGLESFGEALAKVLEFRSSVHRARLELLRRLFQPVRKTDDACLYRSGGARAI
jgi:hypothetical protein